MLCCSTMEAQGKAALCLSVPWLLVVLLSTAYLSSRPLPRTDTSAAAASALTTTGIRTVVRFRAEPFATASAAVLPHLVHCATNQPHIYAGTKSAPAGLAVPDFAFPADADVCKKQLLHVTENRGAGGAGAVGNI